MKPADVFAIVVRTIGLLVCLFAGAILYWGAVNSVLGGPTDVIGLAIAGGPMLGVGLWLLRGVPSIVAFAFPKRREYDQGHSVEGRLA